MKSYILSLVSLLLLAGLSGCSNRNTTDSSNEVSVTYDKFDDYLKVSSLFEGYDVIPLSAPNEESLIRQIRRLLLAEDRVFVMDRMENKLFAFDEKGNFIASTERYIGGGPQEYIRIEDATIDLKERKVYAACDAPYCIMVFDYNLQLLDKISMDYFLIELAVDDECLYGFRWNEKSGDRYELITLDKKNMAQPPRVVLSHTEFVSGLSSTGCNLSAFAGKGILFAMPFSNTIYHFVNGKVVEQYDLNFGSKTADVASYKNKSVNAFLEDNEDKEWSIGNICASDSILLFNSEKIHSYVVDRKNRICSVHLLMDNDILPFTTSRMIATHGLPNVAVYETSFTHYLSYVKNAKPKKVNPEFMRIAQLHNEDSNPVLIVWKFK